MKKIILMCVIACGATNVLAQNWKTLTEDGGARFEAKVGTTKFVKTVAGTPIVIVQGRTTYKSDNSIKLGQWYISESDCKAGKGTLVTLDERGDFHVEHQYVSSLNGPPKAIHANLIADTLCKEYYDKEKPGKGVKTAK